MRKLTNLLLVTAMLGFFACGKDDEGTTPTPGPDAETVLSGEITSDMELNAATKYILRGNVYVTNGAKLTIPAGTVLYGEKATKGSLVITKGSMIDAQGTPANPVVFTSDQPAGTRNRGDWAGVVLLGDAVNNRGTDRDIEGITSGTANAVHGGSNDADNSGTLQYVRIEFAGIALSPDNELNSLTMGSVGEGTTIDHIMVSYANDDAYEWFGGAVNADHLIAYKTLDDDFDTDQGFTGEINYGVVVRDPDAADISGSNAFEADNNKDNPTLSPISAPVFNYFTVVGPLAFRDTVSDIDANYDHLGHLRRGSNITINNSILVGFPIGINFDNPGASANITSSVIANNPNEPVDFVIGSVPGSLDLMEVTDMNTIFNGDSWKDLSNPNPSDVTATYSSMGAFAGAANWNWNAGWVEFDPVNAAY